MREAFALSHPMQVVINAASLSNEEGGSPDLKNMLSADHVVMLDGDGTYPSEHIYDVVTALEDGADVVMGSRLLGEIADGAMTRLNMVGNLILSTAASVLYLQPCSDLCTGLWGFRSAALRRLSLDSQFFDLEAEMFAEAVKNHLRIREVPISYLPRDGETKLVPIKSGAMIMKKLCERRLLNARVPAIPISEEPIGTPVHH